MLYFTEEDVRRLLPMPEAVRLMKDVFQKLAAGEAQNQPRRRLVLPTGSVLHQLAGAYGRYFGAKIYSSHPKHGAHFSVLLCRAEDGRPLATFEANYLGQIRTGAASGAATDMISRSSADTVGMIGTGFQALSQLQAMAAVRALRRIRVWSRSEEKRNRFVRECADVGIAVEAAPSAEAAVREAAIVITATYAKDPVIADDWIARGAHINAIGSNNPNRREIPAETVRRADLIAIDSIEQGKLESGDLLLALTDEEWKTRVMELAEIAAGRVKPPQNPDLTIFKSNGLGVEDIAAAGYVYEASGMA